MPMYDEPVVGARYEDREDDGRQFDVVAFDENDGTVEIQYSDGTTHEFDLDDWYGMDLELLESKAKTEVDEDIPEDDTTDDEDDLDEDEDMELDEDEDR